MDDQKEVAPPTESQKPRLSKKVCGVAGVALIAGTAFGGYAIASAASASPTKATTRLQSSQSEGGPTGVEGGGPIGGGLRGGVNPAVQGTVKSIDSSAKTFTVTNRTGTVVTVDTTSSTSYMDRSVTSASFSTITVGEQVAVIGTTSSSVVTATKILIGTPGGPGSGVPGAGGATGFSGPSGVSGATGMMGSATMPAAVGTVESVDTSAKSFTVKNTAGTTVTVDVSSTTTYRDKGVTSPTFSNVTTGEKVAVIGTTSSSVVTATSVIIGFIGGPNGHGGPGRPGGAGAPGGASGSPGGGAAA